MTSHDPVLDAFLAQQFEEVRELERRSPVLEVMTMDGEPHQLYVATFHARGLVQHAGVVEEAHEARFGFNLMDQYLADDVDLSRLPIVTYLGPHPAPWHPNILPFPPFAVCLHIAPGTPLAALLRGAYELWTYQLFSTWDNGLNPRAASWARSQPAARFPVDSGPLTGRRLSGRARLRKRAPQAAAGAPARGEMKDSQ
jgi:hypothetical protein